MGRQRWGHQARPLLGPALHPPAVDGLPDPFQRSLLLIVAPTGCVTQPAPWSLGNPSPIRKIEGIRLWWGGLVMPLTRLLHFGVEVLRCVVQSHGQGNNMGAVFRAARAGHSLSVDDSSSSSSSDDDELSFRSRPLVSCLATATF